KARKAPDSPKATVITRRMFENADWGVLFFFMALFLFGCVDCNSGFRVGTGNNVSSSHHPSPRIRGRSFAKTALEEKFLGCTRLLIELHSLQSSSARNQEPSSRGALNSGPHFG